MAGSIPYNFYRILGVWNGTSKNMGLGIFWPDLEISAFKTERLGILGSPNIDLSRSLEF